MPRHFALLFLAFYLSCPATTGRAAPKSSEPIDVHSRGFEPFVFRGLTVKIAAGASCGTRFDGFASSPQFPYMRDRGLAYWSSSDANAAAEDELKHCGYTVLAGNGSESNQTTQARYELSGTVVTLQCNTYGPSAGDQTEILANLDWELHDVINKTLIYKERTVGRGKGAGQRPESNQAASASALRDALRELLTKKEFVDVIGKEATH